MKSKQPTLPKGNVHLLPTAAAAPVKQRLRRRLPNPVIDARDCFLERTRMCNAEKHHAIQPGPSNNKQAMSRFWEELGRAYADAMVKEIIERDDGLIA